MHIEFKAELKDFPCQGENISVGMNGTRFIVCIVLDVIITPQFFPSSVIDLFPRARIKDFFWTENMQLMRFIMLE